MNDGPKVSDVDMSEVATTDSDTAFFRLVTHWRFDAPVSLVWQILTAPEDWPSWWRAVVAVRTLDAGDRDGIGAYRQMTWRTALPYRLSFHMRTTQIVRHVLIEGRSEGQLAGIGRWRLAPTDTGTAVTYEWSVSVTKPWMRRAAPILRRLFAWNHGVVMEWGRQGLARKLVASQASQAVTSNVA